MQENLNYTAADLEKMDASELERLNTALLIKAARRSPTFLKLNGAVGNQTLALAKIASTGKTPLVDTQKPLNTQVPKLVQSPLPAAVGDYLQARQTPINAMTTLSDAALADIVAHGIDRLPNLPTPSDYSLLHDTQAARTEQFRRASPSGKSARPFGMSPVSMA